MKIQLLKNKLFLQSIFSTKSNAYNISDILAIVPKNDKIVVVTKNGHKDSIKTLSPCDDCTSILLLYLVDVIDPFGKNKYAFVILTDHSIVNIDEINNIKIKKKDNQEKLVVSFGDFNLSVKENIDFNQKALNRAINERKDAIENTFSKIN